MTERETGGLAFPAEFKDDTGIWQHSGMTLRDYFAAKAMQGYSASPSLESAPPAKIAGWAYEQADAMLKERAK